MMEGAYPTYSPRLVALAGVLDRAALAVHASNWHLQDLEEGQGVFERGDGSLPDWMQVRVELLEAQLPVLRTLVNTMLVAESKPWFEVDVQEDGLVCLPRQVEALLGNAVEPAFHYQIRITHKDDAEVIASQSEALKDNRIILFEGDGFWVPRAIPKSFVEIWWRRYFADVQRRRLYGMALVPRPEYGWDCYGEEI